MGVLLNFDDVTVADYQAPKIEVAIFTFPAAVAAGGVVGTVFLESEHQLCPVYSARGKVGKGYCQASSRRRRRCDDGGGIIRLLL